MKKVRQILRIMFIVWGIVALVGAVGLTGYLVHLFYFDHAMPRGAQTDFASPEDVQRVLRLGQLGDQKYRLEHSYRAERSFIGERCEAVALRLESFPEALLKEDVFAKPPIWSQGPPTNSILPGAIDAACASVASYGPKWFPKAAELKSDRFYLCLGRAIIEQGSVSAVHMLAYDRQEKMLYYAGSDD